MDSLLFLSSLKINPCIFYTIRSFSFLSVCLFCKLCFICWEKSISFFFIIDQCEVEFICKGECLCIYLGTSHNENLFLFSFSSFAQSFCKRRSNKETICSKFRISRDHDVGSIGKRFSY